VTQTKQPPEIPARFTAALGACFEHAELAVISVLILMQQRECTIEKLSMR
jgi:hypothetical protein